MFSEVIKQRTFICEAKKVLKKFKPEMPYNEDKYLFFIYNYNIKTNFYVYN